MARVVDKFVMQLEAQLADRHVSIELTQAARRPSGEDRLRPGDGRASRSAASSQEKIKRPLAEELLFGKLTEGGITHVDFRDGEMVFTFTAEPQAKKKVEGEQEPA